MAEGDTILRLARRIEKALGGAALSVEAPHPRGRAGGIERLDGLRLESATARGKHLLLGFGELSLHSHLAMSGAWHLYREGERWRRPRASAWAVLVASGIEAVQFGGPTLRAMRTERLRRDPALARLGPDILAPAGEETGGEATAARIEAAGELVPSAPFERAAVVASLRAGDGTVAIGEALLDQTRVAGIGNIFKSESCFAARVDPWRPLAEISRDELAAVVEAARSAMLASVEGAPRPSQVYRRAGRPCRRCGGLIRSRGQGEANRLTYWCPGCQGA